MRIITLGARSEAPRPPAEIAEEVEKYAREWDRSGSIELVRAPNGFVCWLIKFTPRPNDPKWLRYREGRGPEPHPELVWLMDNETGKPLDIHQMGASGVRAYLEKGNTLSGRGEYGSVLEAIEQTSARNLEERDRFRQKMKEENRYERRQDRRRYLGIPQISPGIDLKNPDAA